MSDLDKKPPRPEERIMDETDDALADSFPASDPPSQSVPTTPSSPSRPEDKTQVRD